MRKGLIKIMAIAGMLLSAILPISAKEVEAADTLSIQDVFLNLPLNTLDILSKSTRLDMIEYYQNGDTTRTYPNGMEGLSKLRTLSEDYLDVELTPVTTLQIVMLYARKEPACVVLYTINGEGQAADTDVAFFDYQMKELPREKFLKYPDVLDFFDTRDKDVRKRIEEIVAFPTIEFSTEGSPNLTATLTVGEFLGKENYDYIKQYLRPSLKYKWDGKKYRMIKNN